MLTIDQSKQCLAVLIPTPNVKNPTPTFKRTASPSQLQQLGSQELPIIPHKPAEAFSSLRSTIEASQPRPNGLEIVRGICIERLNSHLWQLRRKPVSGQRPRMLCVWQTLCEYEGWFVEEGDEELEMWERRTDGLERRRSWENFELGVTSERRAPVPSEWGKLILVRIKRLLRSHVDWESKQDFSRSWVFTVSVCVFRHEFVNKGQKSYQINFHKEWSEVRKLLISCSHSANPRMFYPRFSSETSKRWRACLDFDSIEKLCKPTEVLFLPL